MKDLLQANKDKQSAPSLVRADGVDVSKSPDYPMTARIYHLEKATGFPAGAFRPALWPRFICRVPVVPCLAFISWGI